MGKVKNKSLYKFTGLNRGGGIDENISAVIEPINKEESFYAKLEMDKYRKRGLWNYMKNHWDEYDSTCIVEHDGSYDSPKNCIVLNINIEEKIK